MHGSVRAKGAVCSTSQTDFQRTSSSIFPCLSTGSSPHATTRSGEKTEGLGMRVLECAKGAVSSTSRTSLSEDEQLHLPLSVNGVSRLAST